MTTKEAPELIALREKMKLAVRTATRLTKFSKEEVMDMADAQEFPETATMIDTTTPEMAARLDAIHSTGARMAADRIIHDSQANALLAEVLGGSEWLLEINDGEDD